MEHCVGGPRRVGREYSASDWRTCHTGNRQNEEIVSELAAAAQTDAALLELRRNDSPRALLASDVDGRSICSADCTCDTQKMEPGRECVRNRQSPVNMHSPSAKKQILPAMRSIIAASPTTGTRTALAIALSSLTHLESCDEARARQPWRQGSAVSQRTCAWTVDSRSSSGSRQGPHEPY